MRWNMVWLFIERRVISRIACVKAGILCCFWPNLCAQNPWVTSYKTRNNRCKIWNSWSPKGVYVVVTCKYRNNSHIEEEKHKSIIGMISATRRDLETNTFPIISDNWFTWQIDTSRTKASAGACKWQLWPPGSGFVGRYFYPGGERIPPVCQYSHVQGRSMTGGRKKAWS